MWTEIILGDKIWLFYSFLLNNIRKGITFIIRKPFFFSLKKKEEN